MFSVFISSTFSDMQHERDLIHKYVYPDVKSISASYGDFVNIIDLRWGVDTSNLDADDAMNHVLDTCCRKIEDSFPFFIAILGYRYGSKVYRFKEQRYADGISVTEFEILHRLAHSSDHVCFFIKTPTNDTYIEPEQKRLIDYIKKNYPENIISYSMHESHSDETDLNEEDRRFIDAVMERIKGFLRFHLESENHGDEFLKYIRETSRYVYGREKTIAEIVRELQSGKKLILIEGSKGVGRRCALYKALSLMDCNVIGVASSSVGSAHSDIELIRQLQRQLCMLLGKAPPEGGQSMQKGIELLTAFLEEYSVRSTKNLYVSIENADELLSEKGVLSLQKILKAAPQNVQFCLTVEQKEALGPLLSEAENCTVNIPFLSIADRKQVISSIYEKNGKELPDTVLKAIVNKPLSAFPDYLNTMLVRMLSFDASDIRFLQESEDTGNSVGDVISNNLKRYVNSLSDVHQTLYSTVWDELASKVNAGIATGIIEWLSFCPDGLRELDLKYLICASGRISELDFFLTFRYMSQLLVPTCNEIYKLKFQIHTADLRLSERYFDYLSSLPKRDIIRERDLFQYCIRYNERLKFYSEAEVYFEEHRHLPTDAIISFFRSDWLERELITDDKYLRTFINGTLAIVLSGIGRMLSNADYHRLNGYLERIFSSSVFEDSPDCRTGLLGLAKASAVLASNAHDNKLNKKYSGIADRIKAKSWDGKLFPIFDTILNALQLETDVMNHLDEARTSLDNGLPVALCRFILDKAKNELKRIEELVKDEKAGAVIPAIVHCSALYEMYYELKGDCFRMEEAYEKAVTMYLKTVRLNPGECFHDCNNQCSHYLKIGLCYKKTCNYEAALRILQRGIEINMEPASFSEKAEEESVKYLLKSHIADCYSMMGEYEEAIGQMITVIPVLERLVSVKQTANALYDYAVACYKILEYECSARINPLRGIEYGYSAASALMNLYKISPDDSYREQLILCTGKIKELEDN